MLISKLHLKKYIENFLGVLDRENILSIFHNLGSKFGTIDVSSKSFLPTKH